MIRNTKKGKNKIDYYRLIVLQLEKSVIFSGHFILITGSLGNDLEISTFLELFRTIIVPELNPKA